jgi:predicted P-loop ATPase
MGAQDSPYVRAVTRKWMTAAVARIMHPGCKFDQMLVLVGPQGVGKSTLAWTLSRGWFSDSLNGMGTKEAFEALRGVWIVELAELAATRRSEEETIKNYLTKRVDTYRPAYARQVVDYPRQCVFYGTTNDPNIIKDRTGGRRYWPVEVRGIDRGQLDGLEAEVDQLWAEATERWKQGETLWMDDETLHRAEQEVQESFTLADDLTGLIEEYLDTPLPENWDDLAVDDRRCYIQGQSLTDPSVCTLRREVVSVLEIRMELFGETRESIGRNDSTTRRICGVLARLHGWERTGRLKRQGPYGPQSVFVRAGQ